MIKRYYPHWQCEDMFPNFKGDWVKHDDHLAEMKRVEAERDELLGLIRNLKAAKDRWDELETTQCGMDCDEWAEWTNAVALGEEHALSALFAKLPSADDAKETT